jgi:hypothetical protein
MPSPSKSAKCSRHRRGPPRKRPANGGRPAPAVGAATGPLVRRADDLGPGRRSHV